MIDLHINYWHYALEIENAGSIRKAAENLYMGQPNLSRALSELEESLGIRIFERSSQGVTPTKEGAEFLISARAVIQHIADVEKQFHPDLKDIQTMHIQVPRSGYTSEALSILLNEIDNSIPYEIKCEESVSSNSVKNIIKAQANLAVIRFHESEMLSYMKIFRENNIVFSKIWEYDYVVRLSANDPLAEKKILKTSDLQGYNEVIHAHRTANMFLPDHDNTGAVGYHKSINRIYVNDRSNQLNIVRSVPKTFMWGAPDMSLHEVEDGLIQMPFEHESLHYHEWLIHRRNYQMTDLEHRFIEILKEIVHRDYPPAE